MTEEALVYNINKDYRVVRIKGNKCSLFFKKGQNQLIATLEGCQDIFTSVIIPADKQELNNIEKSYLLSFIRAKKFVIAKEVAEVLGVSIIKYQDGREEYLSEKMLKRRIAKGIDFAKIFVENVMLSSLKISADARECTYVFGMTSNIKKLIIEENCTINVDFRDNKYIESVVVGEKFSGSLNLSRTSIESVFIDNNCRCNLTIEEAKKCFNVQIADIFSGNVNIVNSCLYALGIGYYSYADFMLSNNIIKKDIVIGDSFRGGFYGINQAVDEMKIGDDCKGWIKLNAQGKDSGIKKLIIADDFSGNLNLAGDESISSIEFGRKNNGKTDASYMTGIKTVKTGKFYSGEINLTEASVHNVFIAYGASGKLVINRCNNLALIQATVDNNLVIEHEHAAKEIKTMEGFVYYNFGFGGDINNFVPLYKKILHNTRKMISKPFA